MFTRGYPLVAWWEVFQQPVETAEYIKIKRGHGSKEVALGKNDL
jgi:hypothetical protein